MREETVTVKIDHPLGSTDEDNPSVVYPINCGYVDVERTAGFSELDKQRVYLLGVDVACTGQMGHWEVIALAVMEWPLGYHPCDIGILTCAFESRRGTLLGGQFDWGGRLLKSNGGVQRFAQLERKSSKRVQTQKRA